ncbi:MAG TPA: type IVB secretion system protein IcmV [Gammaproteobacteria bacterium]|nr:type IVB secretion system protein IcmV [Gammaproteobacteria bacterium]
MKKLLSGVGRAFFPFRNPKRMVGWDQLQESFNSFVRDPAKEVLGRRNKKTKTTETFEQAVTRLNISEEDLSARKKTFFRTALFFVVMAVALFIYTVDLLFSGLLLATFIALVLVVIALALAFREHFWYTQMQQRRLGITFNEWTGYTFRGNKR